jgi:Cu2+-exporting ATPase
MLPQQKADYVRDLQSRGLRVAMFGDGVNDTAGLAQANYSISLRGASDVATDVADVVFLDGNLAKFPLLDHISGNLTRNVKRSFALTLAPNSICIAGAMMGIFGLGASLIFNNVGNLVTVINGSRAQSGLNPDRKFPLPLAAE